MSQGLWQRRRARAVQLLARAPHADEMLGFYVGLVELQEGVAEKVSRASEAIRGPAEAAPSEGTGPKGSEALPRELPWGLHETTAAVLEPIFGTFLRGLESIGTEVIAEAARTLLDGQADERIRALQEFWIDRDPADFVPRAFTEAVASALIGEGGPGDPGAGGGTPTGAMRCPCCGSLPQVGLLRDEPDALGRRLLACTLCATEWPFPRLTCAHCGSTDADHLQVHHAESVPHVRIEACESCARYLKTIDQRRDGAAEAVVEDIATPELDLWASDRGLVKIQPSLLGL